MRKKILQRLLTAAALLAAATLLALGALRTRAIHDRTGGAATTPISEKQLIADSTFGGVERKDGKLAFTYDRSAPQKGKKDCPT
jgi:hypothetical protein